MPSTRTSAGESYWARGHPPRDGGAVDRNSLCFGVFDGDAQVAFARVVTDRATFAYLCDVYVLPPYRGRGHQQADDGGSHRASRAAGAAALVRSLPGCPRSLRAVRITPLARPERHMERTDLDVYTRAPGPDAPDAGGE